MVHEGLRDEGGGEGGPRSRRLETPLQGWVGREGGKKSDKTIERNLNYAPRKMAIVCKAMLIRAGEKEGGRLRRRRQTRGFFFATGELFVLPFFSSSSSVVAVPPSLNLVPRAVAPLFYAPCAPLRLLHLSAHFQDALIIRLLPFVLSIYLRVVFIARTSYGRRNLI